MSLTLIVHADEPRETLNSYLHTVRHTSDAGSLQRLYHEVADELAFRSSIPATHANPDLGGATATELGRILEEIFGQIVSILSQEKASLREISGAYDLLTRELEPQESARMSTYHYDEDEREGVH